MDMYYIMPLDLYLCNGMWISALVTDVYFLILTQSTLLTVFSWCIVQSDFFFLTVKIEFVKNCLCELWTCERYAYCLPVK